MTNPQCRTCRFFGPDEDRPYRGNCNLTLPPWLRSDDHNARVFDENTCSFHQPKPPQYFVNGDPLT